MDIYVMILNVLEEIRDELREHNETLKDMTSGLCPEFKAYYRNKRIRESDKEKK